MCRKMYLRVLVLSIFLNRIRAQTFTPLPAGQECPATSEGWKKFADAWSCPGNVPYHCVINEYGEFGQVCVKESWVQPGFCPEYNTAAKKINVKRCQPFDGFSCSTQAFQSHQTYLHEVCLRKPRPTTTTTTPPDTTITAVKGSSGSPAIPIAVVFLLLLILVAVGGAIWWFKLRKDYEIQNPYSDGKIRMCLKRKKGYEDDNHDAQEKVDLISNSNEKTSSEQTQIRRSNIKFVETKVYSDIISELKRHKVVLVVGKTGIGKSTTCEGVLEYYRDKLKWNTLHLPWDEFAKVLEKSSDNEEKIQENTITLLDITFGGISLYSYYDQKIENLMNRLYTLTRKCKEYKVLITSSGLLTPETDLVILKECSKMLLDNTSYKTEDLKKLYEKYTGTKLSIEDETTKKSEGTSTVNQMNDEDNDWEFNMPISSPDRNETFTDSEIEKKEDIPEKEISSKSDQSTPLSASMNSVQSENINLKPAFDAENDTSHLKMSGDEKKGMSAEDPNGDQELNDGDTDPSEVKIRINDDTWRRTHVSEFGLPTPCYLPDGIQRDSNFSENAAMRIIEGYVTSLSDSSSVTDRQKYSSLVYIMLNGSSVESNCVHKQLLSQLDITLTIDRFSVRATEMVEHGILRRRGNVYSFSNDILLFAVMKLFASGDIRTFMEHCYLPFIWQFIKLKSDNSSEALKIEVEDSWLVLCNVGTALMKRSTNKGKEFERFQVFEAFRDKLRIHELATQKKFKCPDKIEKVDRKSRNKFLKKMIKYHPYLKEYYQYAEPEEFITLQDKKWTQPKDKDLLDCCKNDEQTGKGKKGSKDKTKKK